jgi:hypothetical protein
MTTKPVLQKILKESYMRKIYNQHSLENLGINKSHQMSRYANEE